MARPRIFVLLVAASLIGGCKPPGNARVVGSGMLVTATPRMEAFDEVELVGGFRVVVEVGGAPSLSIRTDDNIMPLIETGIERGTLSIRMRENLVPSDGVTLNIVTPTLSRFAAEGSVIGEIKDVEGASFALVVNGVGKITATGTVADLVLVVHGAGGIDAYDLEASTVDATLKGAGRIRTHAVRKLKVTAAGFGVLEYRGDPQLTKSTSALARIIKME